VIPPSVTSIGDFAFSGCSSLEFAIIEGFDTILEMHPFINCSNLRIVILPAKEMLKPILSECPLVELIVSFHPKLEGGQKAGGFKLKLNEDEKTVAIQRAIEQVPKSYSKIRMELQFPTIGLTKKLIRLHTYAMSQRPFHFTLLVEHVLRKTSVADRSLFDPNSRWVHPARALPHLPIELWLHIFTFISRCSSPHEEFLKDLPALDHPKRRGLGIHD
jgi:hypothetical protein